MLTRDAVLSPDLAAATVRREGLNVAVGTDPEGVGTTSAAFNWLAAASLLQLSSSNAADTAAGTGARTVYIAGLDESLEPVSETVALNGQTAVPTVNAYLRVLELRVQTVGSGGVAAGDVYLSTGALTNGVPDDTTKIYGKVLAGYVDAYAAVHTVQNGRVGFLIDLSYAIGHDSDSGTVRLWLRESGGLARLVWSRKVAAAAGAECFEVPVRIPAGADIWLDAEMDTEAGEVGATLYIIETYGI